MKIKLWQKCVMVFILFHWALFFLTFYILQREFSVPQFALSALEVPLIPFLLTSLAFRYLPLSPGGALERAAAIILPTLYYAGLGAVVGLVIEKMRRGREKRG